MCEREKVSETEGKGSVCEREEGREREREHEGRGSRAHWSHPPSIRGNKKRLTGVVRVAKTATWKRKCNH